VVRSIYHVRHGETDWNAAGRLQGGQDIPLNDLGRSQADGNGRALAAHFAEIGRSPTEFRYVASPLGRARETMERVRRGLGLPIDGYDVAPGLREVSFGRYEGWSYDDLATKAPDDWAALQTDKWNFVPPDGESYAMLIERLRSFVAGTEGDLVLVSHGGVFRVLRAIFEANEDHELAHLIVPQDRIYLWRDGQGTWL
jgi:probable phosphoglycerate mutase